MYLQDYRQDEKNRETFSVSFTSRNVRGTRKFLRSFWFTTYVSSRLHVASTERTKKFPCSFHRQNRKELGMFHVPSIQQRMYLHDYMQHRRKEYINFPVSFTCRNERNKEIFAFFSACNISP